MVISLTPQWMAILPMLTVALVALLCLIILALFAAYDAWVDRQFARMAALRRQDEHEANRHSENEAQQ